MRAIRWIPSLAVLAGALLSGIPGAAQSRPVVGVGVHQLDVPSLRRLDDLGVQHVRYTVYWGLWDRNEPGYRQRVDRELGAAARAGLNLLVVVHQQPDRYSFRNRRDAYAAYARFVGMLAARYPAVDAWQLWNEMDAPAFTDLFGSRDGVAPRQQGRMFGEMLKLAYPAIKKVNPRAKVVTGGITGHPRDGWVRGLLDSGAPWDVLALHSYGFPLWPGMLERGRAARAILGSDSRPIWTTEFGMEVGVVPPGWSRARREVDNWHLENWRDPVVGNEKHRVFARVYGHVLTQDGDLSYDLIRRDGSLRPAARWLRDYLR